MNERRRGGMKMDEIRADIFEKQELLDHIESLRSELAAREAEVRKLQSFRPKDGGRAVDKSLRDEITIAAMQGLLAAEKDSWFIDTIARGAPINVRQNDLVETAYSFADAMLAAREESE
jgi:hypothetical protein